VSARKSERWTIEFSTFADCDAYVAAEWGHSGVQPIPIVTTSGWYSVPCPLTPMTTPPCWLTKSKRSAQRTQMQAFLDRVIAMVAHAQGAAGKPLTKNGIRICRDGQVVL